MLSISITGKYSITSSTYHKCMTTFQSGTALQNTTLALAGSAQNRSVKLAGCSPIQTIRLERFYLNTFKTYNKCQALEKG